MDATLMVAGTLWTLFLRDWLVEVVDATEDGPISRVVTRWDIIAEGPDGSRYSYTPDTDPRYTDLDNAAMALAFIVEHGFDVTDPVKSGFTQIDPRYGSDAYAQIGHGIGCYDEDY